jgi:hypothetical protein
MHDTSKRGTVNQIERIAKAPSDRTGFPSMLGLALRLPGRGTPSRRAGRVASVLAVAAAALAVAASAAQATKYFDSFFGTTLAGVSIGGTFSTSGAIGGVGDIAVNDPGEADGNGVDGWVYVVDRTNNRVQAFDQDKSFQWAIGRDVIASTVNEQQLVTLKATGGTYTLIFNGSTTTPIAFNASTATVDNALDVLPSIAGDANVVVTGSTGGPYVVTFAGALAAANQPQMTADSGLLSGTASVSTLADGLATVPGDLGDAFEKCTVAAHCKAGSTGTATDGPGGEFNGASGIDVDQDTGDFYVRERNSNARVQQFTADGDFVRAFGWDVALSGPGNDITGTPNELETCNAAAGDVCKAGVPGLNQGQFGSSTTVGNGLAIAPLGAPNAGTVYVADPGNRRILPFTVPAGPTAAVAAGQAFGSSSQFATANQPLHLAADENGIVYGSDGAGGGSASVSIARFDTVANTFESSILGDDLSVLGRGGVRSIEVDQSDGHLWVGRNSTAGIMELDVSTNPPDVSLSSLVETHAAGLNIGSPEDSLAAKAIGVNPVSGELFVSTGGNNGSGSGSGNRVLVLDDTGIDPPPTVELLPPTNVGATTATLQANINPNGPTGFPTRYRFQVSKTGLDGDWHDIASEQLVGGDGDGGATVFIDDAATGLEPNSLFRVRVVTTRKPDGGVAISAELIFQTDPAPPVVETRPAQHVSDVGARLVGSLNPGGLATEYWFEWGDTDFANTVPVPAAAASGGLDRLVGEALSGLVPERVYLFRLCARNSLAATKLCGAERTFTTRPEVTSPDGARHYEMVLSPDKPLRRGGERGRVGLDYTRREAGMAAPDGTAYRSHLFAGATDPEAGHGFTRAYSHERRHRDSGGIWRGDAIFNVAPVYTAANNTAALTGESADLRVSAWRLTPSVFADAGNEDPLLAVRAIGDTGGPRGAGWYPWLDHAWFTGNLLAEQMSASIDDEGRRLVAQPAGVDGSQWRDVTPADDTLPPGGLTPPQTSGKAVFLSDSEHDWRPSDLVNECTGGAGSATVLPSRDDNGTPSGPTGSFSTPGASYTTGSTTIDVSSFVGGSTADVKVGHFIFGAGIPAGARVTAVTPTQITISQAVTSTQAFPGVTITGGQNTAALADDTVGIRSCQAGSPTDVRGAILGSRTGGRLGETAAAAMSRSGDRVFFLSPDPTVAEGQATCEIDDAAVGAGTRCPAQLFVRQFDDDGDPIVRWLSRPEDALFEDGGGDPQQSPASVFGHGVAFEGASRDGSVVYFRTDAPLLEDDLNGGDDPLTSASPRSWDLYRYDLGTDNDVDPALGDPGDRLTRVSGGPSGTADPNTNCVADAPDCGGAVNGRGQVVRFISDDGDRVYFVTTAQIPGADNVPPADSSAGNQPTGSGDQTAAGLRNIYAYDADETGAAAYKFVARVPFNTDLTKLDSCVSADGTAGYLPHLTNMQGFAPANVAAQILKVRMNCVRGSGSGDAIAFATTAQLTADDSDTAADVYVYDADEDRLTRLSAPRPGTAASAYPCLSADELKPPSVVCNGDLGFGMIDDAADTETALIGGRHTNISQDADGDMTAVYFESRLPLVEDDLNAADSAQNGGMDVYRWGRDGRLSLVSPGNSGDSAFYAGNGLNGRDVFFWTEQRISPWEIDRSDGDVYNATTRTDLRPPPPVSPPVCAALGGFCQGGGAAPVVSGPRTASPPAGGGNARAVERATLTVARVAANARRLAARRGVLALRVRASRAGSVTAVARARMRSGSGRWNVRRVAAARTSARAGRAAVLRLRLSVAARRELRLGRPLRLSVRVTQPGARARTATVLLRRPAR